MRFSTAFILLSAAICAAAAPVSHVSSHSHSSVAHPAAHVHNVDVEPTHFEHEDETDLLEHSHSLNPHATSHGDLEPRSMEHMNELEARSPKGGAKKGGKGGKKHHKKGKKHHKKGKKHHKKGKKHHKKGGKGGKGGKMQRQKQAAMQAQ